MKRLYIPVSTFNFNNILSSESISPKAFYERRGFGYSRWLPIAENDVDNAILLYDKPFEFSRPISDVEDHPMLVEITTDEDFPQVEDGIYYSDHTIYLSPWCTKFIFFSERVKRIVMSLSDSSLETKMMRIYGKRFMVENHKQQVMPKISLNLDLNEKEVDKDFQTNKMKGLLYGYYIGSLLSISSDLVKKNNLLQELQDLFYAVLSSEERKLTFYQNERLGVLIANLNKNNPVISYLQKQLANPDDIELVINQCVKMGAVFPNIVSKTNIVSSLTYPKAEKNQAIEWLEIEQNQLKRQILQERKYLSVSEEEIIVSDCALSKISPNIIPDKQENELMINWVNEVLSSKNYNGNISSFRENLSDKITIRAKEQYQEDWENSFAKQILNLIRKYVRGQEASFQWNNGLYSSIAAVLAKGSDWNELLAFMKMKGMSDYRLAFAFYGELNGFANLTRDFTDNIFNIDDWEYLAEVYKEIYGQLLGVSPTNYGKNLEIPNSMLPKKEQTALSAIVISAWEKIDKGKKTKKEIFQLTETLNKALDGSNANLELVSFIEVLSSCKGWSKKTKVWQELKKELLAENPIKNTLNRKELTYCLNFADDATYKEKKRHIFGYQFIDEIIDVISTILFDKNEKLIGNLKKDLEWVLEPKYSSNVSNKDLIEKFKNQLKEGATSPKSKNGKDLSWKNELYKNLDIDAIIRKLHNEYDENKCYVR